MSGRGREKKVPSLVTEVQLILVPESLAIGGERGPGRPRCQGASAGR